MEFDNSTYETLNMFWEDLSDTTKAFFRSIMRQSTSGEIPPKTYGPKNSWIEKLLAVEKFKEDIETLDLGDESEEYWQNFDYLSALDDMREKGLKWVKTNHFKVYYINLRTWS